MHLVRLVIFAGHAAAGLVLRAYEEEKRSTTSYPFKQLVAFGDELTDNGNGSSAHGIAGDPEFIYGFNTWTNGPVAVMYLAGLLGVPLADYAWGGCCGGSPPGAVLDNSYTSGAATWNGKPVPDLKQQIESNYTLQPNNLITQSLHFIWIGENDLSFHTDAFWLQDPQNAAFAQQYAARVLAEAEFLASKGAPYVFIANIYPKNLAPVTKAYLCSDGSCQATWGQIIQQANKALQNALAGSKYSSKFIYYDSFTYISFLLNYKDQLGFTEPVDAICDGNHSTDHYQQCVSGAKLWDGARPFFWMNYVQPTTIVHQLIAQDMFNTINKFLSSAGVSSSTSASSSKTSSSIPTTTSKTSMAIRPAPTTTTSAASAVCKG